MKKRDIQRLAHPGETWPQTLARIHHEAYMVEAFGFEHSGVSAKQFLALIKAGVLHAPDPDKQPEPSAFEVVFEASTAFARAPNKQQLEMRVWSANKWRKYLNKQVVPKSTDIDQDATIKLKDVALAVPSGKHLHDRDADNLARHWQDVLSPPPAPPPGEPDHLATIKVTTKRLDKTRRYAAAQAMERAGIFCKRLGELTGGDFSQPTTERWHFDKILDEVDPELRGRRLKIIRRHVQQAIQDGWSKQELASNLQLDTQDYARDWMRVAITELQNAWNEGVALTAIQDYGMSARVARIPETTACDMCRKLFLDEEGNPRIFLLHKLIQNGNNMNVPKGQWKATLTSIHPRCRCGTQPCPDGYRVLPGGLLTRLDLPPDPAQNAQRLSAAA